MLMMKGGRGGEGRLGVGRRYEETAFYVTCSI
jgi:hypothetical protein